MALERDSIEVRTAINAGVDYDVIVIGAGFAGIRAIYEMRKLGLSVRCLEMGSDVGGTWYWNRYPGARTDSEAWSYCYCFSRELWDEWDWRERMPCQADVQAYLGHAADRFDLRRSIQFNAAVSGASFDPETNNWSVTQSDGKVLSCRYLVSATGLLSHVLQPPFEGLQRFEGQWYLTARWPKEPVSFTGKRVAVVGSGSTAVQAFSVIAHTAEHVSMFQRTPNFVLPARNFVLESTQREAIKADFDNIWSLIRSNAFAFPIEKANRLFKDVGEEERQRIFEAGWETGGFRFAFETFDDLLTDAKANEAASEFIRSKIRAIVRDPKIAELLCPYYPFLAKRPPLGHFFYETFNRSNVSLIDARDEAIVRITKAGIETTKREHHFDILVFATGFDAGTGALTNINVCGTDGRTLREKWQDGPRTHLGIAVDGYPNFFMLSGPQSSFSNLPPIAEGGVSWLGKVLTKAREENASRIEVSQSAVDRWIVRLQELTDATLIGAGEAVHGWHLGANVPGKARAPQFYFGGGDGYLRELQASIEGQFSEFTFSPAAEAGRAQVVAE